MLSSVRDSIIDLSIYPSIYLSTLSPYEYKVICMCTVYVCKYVCVYIYIYAYPHTQIQAYSFGGSPTESLSLRSFSLLRSLLAGLFVELPGVCLL